MINAERGLSVVLGVLIRFGDNPRRTIGNALKGIVKILRERHTMEAYQVEDLPLKNEGVQRIYNLLN